MALSPLVVAIPRPWLRPVTSAPTWAQLVAFTLPVQFADPTTPAPVRGWPCARRVRLGTSSEAASPLAPRDDPAAGRTRVASEDVLYAQATAEPPRRAPSRPRKRGRGIQRRQCQHAPGRGDPRRWDQRLRPPVCHGRRAVSLSEGRADALLAALQSPAGKAAVAAAGFRSGRPMPRPGRRSHRRRLRPTSPNHPEAATALAVAGGQPAPRCACWPSSTSGSMKDRGGVEHADGIGTGRAGRPVGFPLGRSSACGS